MMILSLLIIGIVVYLLLKNHRDLTIVKQSRDESIEILKQRYVNGEINDEEYKRMIKIISD
ncbi:MAG: SHOCT domain-containing protein [Alkaliphilus sp.]|nr:SHOCT domain-containing protein [Alkaliphilus sp.]